MNDGLAKIADGFSLVAEGIRVLTEIRINVNAEPEREEPKQKDKTETAVGIAKAEKTEMKIKEIRAVQDM